MTRSSCGVCGRIYSECICIPRACASCRETADRCYCDGRAPALRCERERELDRELGVETKSAPRSDDLEERGRKFAEWFVDGKDATEATRILVRMAWIEGAKAERARMAGS